MAKFDLFNGDADGICALKQLRLADPKDSTLVAGIKRDIKLLKNLTEKVILQIGYKVTVLDVSMAKTLCEKQFIEKNSSISYARRVCV